ncbi:MAG TPA: ABC transporter ATP-binding protein [Thermoanaerobaculia bacterium]|nr:ABC transporter ATP-binding protein [Thermoanaerobaculia bacterium]
MAPLIEIDDLSRRFGRVAALDCVSLAVEEGEWLVVMGPSGSGKTTLLNLLAGLDRPSAGRLAVAGSELSALGPRELARFRRETVGLVFQEFHLIPYLTALENVMLAQYVHSLTDRGEAAEALARVGLEERLEHLPSQLSGGEKQRLCVARALINHPRLILADEPTGNLDEDNERQVLEIFTGLHRRGQTLVLVTHNPEVAVLADRVVRLEHGRVAAAGVAAEKRALQVVH